MKVAYGTPLPSLGAPYTKAGLPSQPTTDLLNQTAWSPRRARARDGLLLLQQRCGHCKMAADSLCLSRSQKDIDLGLVRQLNLLPKLLSLKSSIDRSAGMCTTEMERRKHFGLTPTCSTYQFMSSRVAPSTPVDLLVVQINAAMVKASERMSLRAF